MRVDFLDARIKWNRYKNLNYAANNSGDNFSDLKITTRK